MAEQKIKLSELPTLSDDVEIENDFIPLVDTSTSTTKKITPAKLAKDLSIPQALELLYVSLGVTNLDDNATLLNSYDDNSMLIRIEDN